MDTIVSCSLRTHALSNREMVDIGGTPKHHIEVPPAMEGLHLEYYPRKRRLALLSEGEATISRINFDEGGDMNTHSESVPPRDPIGIILPETGRGDLVFLRIRYNGYTEEFTFQKDYAEKVD